jgi:hypothetical protein
MARGPDRYERGIQLECGLLTGMVLAFGMLLYLPLDLIGVWATAGILALVIAGFAYAAVEYGDRAYHLIPKILDWFH